MKHSESPHKSMCITCLWYVAWLTLLFPSCAPKVITISPITPKVTHLWATAENTAAASKKTEAHAQKVAVSAKSEAATIDAGLAKAEALRTAKTVTQADLEANAKLWDELHTSNALMLEAAKDTVIDAHEMTNAATATSVEAVQLEKDAVATDKGIQDLKTANASLTEDAGAWRKLKWAGIVLLVVAVILFFAFEVFPRVIAAAKPPGT